MNHRVAAAPSVVALAAAVVAVEEVAVSVVAESQSAVEVAAAVLADSAAEEWSCQVPAARGAVGGGGQGVVVGAMPMAMRYSSSSSGASLFDLASSIYGVTGPHLLLDFPVPDEKYDVSIHSTRAGRDQVEPLRKAAIEAAFGLSAIQEKHDLDAYVLTVKNKEAKGLRPTATANSSGWHNETGKISAVNVNLGSLANRLEPLLKQPVVDETGMQGKYDYELKWDQPDVNNPNTDALVNAVRDQLGLELTLAKRPIDVTVVSQKQQPQRVQVNAFKN